MNTLLSENVSYVRRGNVEKSAAISGFTSAGIYIDSNILNNKAVRSVAHGSCQDNIDTRFRTIKLMGQQALTGLPVYDFYEIDKYIHSKEFRNKVALEALGTEIDIVSVGGIGNYVKQKYLQYLDSLEVTDVYYGFGYTAGVLVDIIIGEYLESELVGAVFKDTSNTAQADQKAEKAVAESGEEVLEQTGKAAGKVVGKSGEEFLEQTEKAIESGSKAIPDKARDIAKQVKANNGAPPKGYKGGRTYKNIPLEDGAQKLPEGVNYKEYDINPYVKGQNRGAERIVIGDDGSVWYTDDHYYTFTQIE